MIIEKFIAAGVKHLWTKNKALDKGNHGGHLKLDNLFMGCEDIKSM